MTRSSVIRNGYTEGETCEKSGKQNGKQPRSRISAVTARYLSLLAKTKSDCVIRFPLFRISRRGFFWLRRWRCKRAASIQGAAWFALGDASELPANATLQLSNLQHITLRYNPTSHNNHHIGLHPTSHSAKRATVQQQQQHIESRNSRRVPIHPHLHFLHQRMAESASLPSSPPSTIFTVTSSQLANRTERRPRRSMALLLHYSSMLIT